MTGGKNKIGDLQLHAYVDGELDAEARAEVEVWLSRHPEDKDRIQAYQSQAVALHNLYDPILEEPLPDSLKTLAAKPSSGPPASWMRIAAAIMLLATGGAGGWLARDAVDPGAANAVTLIDPAVGAHAVYVTEVLHPVEVKADQEAHLVAWLSKRLGKAVKAPDMARAGFALVGGRLLPDEGRPAAQFMYENREGRRVTLYVRSDDGPDTAFKYAAEDGISAFYWIDGSLAYALIGNTSRESLLELARISYEAL
mgnify:CR=1 FL=1